MYNLDGNHRVHVLKLQAVIYPSRQQDSTMSPAGEPMTTDGWNSGSSQWARIQAACRIPLTVPQTVLIKDDCSWGPGSTSKDTVRAANNPQNHLYSTWWLTWGTAEWRSWSRCCLSCEDPLHLTLFPPSREEPYVHPVGSVCVLSFPKWCVSVMNELWRDNVNVLEVLTLSFNNLLSGVRFSCSFLFRCLSPIRAELSGKEIIGSIYSRCRMQAGYIRDQRQE